MPPAPPPAHALEFTRELTRSGLALMDLLSELVDAVTDSAAFEGEEPATVILEMAAGSVAVHLRAVPAEELERATALIQRALDAIIADLRMAARIAGRRT